MKEVDYNYKETDEKYSLFFYNCKGKQWELSLLKNDKKIVISSLTYKIIRPINISTISSQDEFNLIIDNIIDRMRITHILPKRFDQKALNGFKNISYSILTSNI